MRKAMCEYGVELELGSMDTVTHVISDKYGKTLYSTAEELFEKKAPMERIASAFFEELMLDFVTDMICWLLTAKNMTVWVGVLKVPLLWLPLLPLPVMISFVYGPTTEIWPLN